MITHLQRCFQHKVARQILYLLLSVKDKPSCMRTAECGYRMTNVSWQNIGPTSSWCEGLPPASTYDYLAKRNGNNYRFYAMWLNIRNDLSSIITIRPILLGWTGRWLSRLLRCNDKYEVESVNRSQMDIKHVIFQHGKSIYFSTYPPPTLIHLSHRFTSASKPTAA
jgi:hypothetical protein